jgi:hypothetical protein
MPALHRSTLIRGLLAFVQVMGIVVLAAGAQTLSLPSFAVALTEICSSATQAELSDEMPYLAENAEAMRKMMSAMAVQPTGDVDRDFVSMMSPHHQGAIDMAKAVLRNGHDEQIRRLAQEIIVTQQQEIMAMRLAIGDPLPPSVTSPTRTAGPVDRP